MALLTSLARIAVETPSDEITPSARQAGKKLLLDTWGVSIAAWNSPGMRSVWDQMNYWGGREEATAMLYGGKFPLPNAVYFNSALAHALDFDDIHVPSSMHLSCIIWPTVLAVAEATGANGRDILDAAVVGFESACRIGAIYDQRNTRARGKGFLPSSIIGGLGAAGAACRLFGHGLEVTVNAMGLAYSQACGNRQALLDKTLAKRMQPAMAGRNAIWSVEMAARGLTGPHNAIEGRAGLFPMFLGIEAPEPNELERKHVCYEIERSTVKRFIGCGGSYPVTLSALELAEQHDLGREDIEELGIYWPPDVFEPNGDNLVGQPFTLGDDPQVSAQFSAAYCVALAILRRKVGLAQFTNEQIRNDTEVAELASNVKVLDSVENPPPPGVIQDDDFPDHIDKPHLLIVRTRDGRELRQVHTNRECLDPKYTPIEVVRDKFRQCAEFSGICSAPRAERIMECVDHFSTWDTVGDFYQACGLEDTLVMVEQQT